MNCTINGCDRFAIPMNLNGKEYVFCDQCAEAFKQGVGLGVKMGERLAEVD